MIEFRALSLSSLLILIALGAIVAGCELPPAESPGGSAPASDPQADDPGGTSPTAGRGAGPGPEEVQPRTLDVPESGVHLGWGWDSRKDRARPTVCVEFEMARDEGQTKYMTFKEVSDTYEVMTSMGMSAAASVDAIGYKASGKAEFAKSASTSGFSSSFVMNVAIDNGVVFAAPVPEGAAAGEVSYLDPTAPMAHHGAVRLTSLALGLAKRGEEVFRERCGDSFVAALYGGAELTALITIMTTTHAEQEEVSAEMSGSGWGAEVQAGFSESSGSKTSSFENQMSFFQVGGRGDPLPKHQTDLLAKLADLPQQAAAAPATFRMTVVPYTTLMNWPSRFDLEVDSTEQVRLASDWGAYRTLYDEIQQVLDAPAEYVFRVPATEENAEDVWVVGGVDESATPKVDSVAALEELQDEVHQTLRHLRGLAVRCGDPESTCEFDESMVLDPYGIRVRLPLPQEETVRTVEHLVEFHVRDAAQRRCDISPINPGCLSNAEVDDWVRRAGRRSLRLDSPEAAERLRAAQGPDDDWFEVLPGSRFVYVEPWRLGDLNVLLVRLDEADPASD